MNDGEDACGCIDRHDCSSAAGFFAVGDENWAACVMCNVKAEHVTRHTSRVTCITDLETLDEVPDVEEKLFNA